MENKVNSLESFLLIIETQYPEIKKLVSEAREKTVKIDLPIEEGVTFVENSKVLEPLFDLPSKFGIKKSLVSYNEKYGFYNITIELY
jgi:hypothetical protein